jgi:large repetitive protein
MKPLTSFFRVAVVFCLIVLAGSAMGQSLVGTNTPGTARNHTFNVVAGVTNFSLILTGTPLSAFSHLLVRKGVAATDVDYDFASQWDGTNNTIFLETPQVSATNFHIRVRTPANSATHNYTVVLRTNTGGFKNTNRPVMKPLTSGNVNAWITNGGRHYYRFEMPTNLPWQVLLDCTNVQPHLYLQRNDLPSETFYLKRSINLTNDGFGLSDLESAAGTYYVGVFSDPTPVSSVRYTLNTKAIVFTPLAWDPGLTHEGTLVHTNNTGATNDYYFKITTINSPVGAWRTALKVTAGEADLYMSRGTIPTASANDYRSTRVGSDGFVLYSTQFNPSEDWYIMVRAWTNSQWTLVSGTPYVQDLGVVTADGSSGSGSVQIGPEAMRFFRTSMPTDVLAWRLWLNGATNTIFVKKTGVPLPLSFEQSNAVQLLVVPPYLIGGDQYFVGVNGNPGVTINLDSREQPIIDLPYDSSTGENNLVNTYGYVTYRVQVPPERIAWQITTPGTNGNPNVAVRRNLVPNENYNDAFSEQPRPITDSIVLVPPVLSDGTFYITVYGTNNFHYTLQNGTPVITDINYTSVTVNDDPTRVGWRFYRAADINQQLGSLGWELFLSNAPPNTKIALRRNATPSIWNLRTPLLSLSNVYDVISKADYLQRPAQPLDVWYVGIYNPSNALGAFTLYTRELFADNLSGDAQTRVRSNVLPDRWEFFRVTIPANILGWDIRVTNVTAGAPRIVVRKEAFPTFVGNSPWSPASATAWPSGAQWAPVLDWTRRQFAVDTVTSEEGRVLAMGMGRPLEPGVYYVGVLSTNPAPASYTFVSRFIGDGYSIPVIDIDFNNGSAGGILGPREAAYFRVVTPSNAPNWKVKLNMVSGDAMLVVSTNRIPHIEAEKRVQKSLETRDEQFLLLASDGGPELWGGKAVTNYLVVIGEGQNPTNSTRIGVGDSQFIIRSVGAMEENDLGHLSAGDLVFNDILDGGEAKGYYFTTAPNLWGFWITLENTVGYPVVVTHIDPFDPYGVIRYYSDPGTGNGASLDTYGNIGGGIGLASSYGITSMGTYPLETMMVKARSNPGNTWSNASYTLRVTPINPEPLGFDGGFGGVVHMQNMNPDRARYFVVTVPPDALGWDVRLTNVTAGAPILVIARDALAGIPYSGSPTFGFYPNPFVSTNWPSGARWGATRDWTERPQNAAGQTEDGRILAMGMGRPLSPGTYTIVADSMTTAPITCDLVSRGIGPGYSIPVRDLAFDGGMHTNRLPAREAAYYKVQVPAGVPNWKVKVNTTNQGEVLLIALKDAIPNVGATLLYGTVTNASGGKRMQKIWDEYFLLLPEPGQSNLIAGTYYLAVVGEGRNATNVNQVGLGLCDYTIKSMGVAPVRNLGLISSQEIYDTNSLEASEIQLYQFSVSNAISMEVELTNRVGTPVLALRSGPRFPYPGAFGPGVATEYHGNDGGEVPPGNLAHMSLIVVPNPADGIWSLAVKARMAPNGIWSNATYVLRVNVISIEDVPFDGGSYVVRNQPHATWRFFRVEVPPDAVGWDVRLTNVISGAVRMVVRRGVLPNQLTTGPWSQPHLKFSWDTNNTWAAASDWTRRQQDVNGVSEDNRVLVMGMGRPMEPGTYYVGVNNNSGQGPLNYTVASRGIGPNYTIPVVDLAFNGGTATHPGLMPREAAYYRVVVPDNAPSWKVRMTALSGESMLVALHNSAPSVDSIATSGSVTNGRGMQKFGNEHLLTLPLSAGTNIYVSNPGTNYLAVVSEGLNPANSSRVGSGPSSHTITSIGTMSVHDFGITTVDDILYSDTLQGGEVKAYQFTSRPELFGIKVRLEQRVGNPIMSLVQGFRFPDPGASSPLVSPESYGTDGGVASPVVHASQITIANPSNYLYTFVVKARGVSSVNFPDSSYTIRIQEVGIRDLNFDAALNTNGQSHIATGELEDNERSYYRVVVPATLNGEKVVGWQLQLAQSSGIAFLRVRKDQLPNDNVTGLMPFTPATGIIVPPYLTNGVWFVEIKGSNTTVFTLTSSHITLERPAWLMPGPGVAGGSPGVTAPDFGDSGVDTNGAPVPPDQSVFLEQGALHYYAVRVPTNNYGLLRVQLQAISGNPDLYVRTNFPPTLHHSTSGGSGTVFDRSMVAAATEYANWVPLDGRIDTRLTHGLWYMVVRAAGNANARYRLVVSTGTITDMPIHGPESSVQALAGGDWRYYRVVMPQTIPINFNAAFTQLSGDVVMYVRDTIPPGNGATANISDIKTWFTDSRNTVPNTSYDVPNTYTFGAPPIRIGGTYYFGFRAVNDATFTLQFTTNGGPNIPIHVIPFYAGTATTNLGPYGTALYRIDVPADATRWKHTSVHSNDVQLALENGTYPLNAASDDWRSVSANGALNISLRGSWPWVPNVSFFLLMTNKTDQARTVTFNMDGKNAATEDDDNDGILDWWEYQYFGNTSYTATADPDGDGVNNRDEYAEGTNPNDRTSYRPRLTITAVNGSVAKNPNQTNFAMGDSVIITATASNNYVFAGWSGHAIGLTNPLNLLMNTNKNITANFKLPGDNWIIAFSLAGGSATATCSNVNYTKETGEPNHAGNTGGRSVWWKWTAPYDGQTTVRTLGSTFPTTLGIYTGTLSVSNLTLVGSDYNSLGGLNRSRVIFDAVAGTMYSIAVDGYNGATGNIQLELASVQPVSLTSVVFLPDGSAQVVGQGAPNMTYFIEASNDLVTWTEFGSVPSDATGAFSFTDADAPNAGARFYRARN